MIRTRFIFFLLAAFLGWLPCARASLPAQRDGLAATRPAVQAALADHPGELYAPMYDGNGNILGYFETNTGVEVASYEYSPFGEIKGMFGSRANELPFRFSSKYHDEKTNQLYYGYRYYKPSAGRWISRDPIQEDGGLNVYGFANNDPINGIDVLGLDIIQATGWDPLSGGRPSPVLMTPGPASTGILTGAGLEVLDMPGPDVSGAIHDQNTLAMIADRMHSINMSNWITARNGGSNFIPHVVNFHFLEEAGDLSYYRNEIGEFIIPSQMSGQFGFDGGRTANMFEYASIHINLHGSGTLENAGGLSQFTYGVSDFFADTDMKIAAYGIAKWLKTEDGSAYLAEHKGETVAAIAAGVAAYYAVKKAAPWMKGKFDDLLYARKSPKTTPKLLGAPRDNLLNAAENPRLRDAINNLYRPEARLGSGSSMDALRIEGSHLEKVLGRRKQLQRIINNETLSATDKKIAKDLLIDIQDALSGHIGGTP